MGLIVYLTVTIFEYFQRDRSLGHFPGEPTLFDDSFPSWLESRTTVVTTQKVTEDPSLLIVSFRFPVAPAPVPVGLPAGPAPVPPPVLAAPPASLVVPEPVEHEVVQPWSPVWSLSRHINNNMREDSNTSLQFAADLFHPHNVLQFIQGPSEPFQYSEAMFSDNEGAVGPLQPHSSQSKVCEQSLDCMRGNWTFLTIKRSMRPSCPNALFADCSSPMAKSETFEKTQKMWPWAATAWAQIWNRNPSKWNTI